MNLDDLRNKILRRFWQHAMILQVGFLKFVAGTCHGSKARKILFSDKMDLKPLIEAGFLGYHHEVNFRHLRVGGFEAFDLVVPLDISDLLFLDSCRNAIENSPLPIPEPNVIALCNDKHCLNQLLSSGPFRHLIPVQGTRAYPYMLKKRIDEWGKNAFLVFRPEDEARFEARLTDPGYFTEEMIPGRAEYAAHILMRDGKVVFGLTIKYAFTVEHPIKGQIQPYYTRISRTKFIRDFQAILQSIGFNGICCVNFKMKNSRPVILEINPRFGSSLCPYFALFIGRIFAGA